MTNNRNKSYGFTLLEMAIVLLISATIVGGGVYLYDQKLTADRVSETKDKLLIIENALIRFFVTHGRLPCPGLSTLDPTQGIQAFGGPGDSSSTTCNATALPSSGNIIYGYVPFTVLGLEHEQIYDGWGRRIGYVVNQNCTVSHKTTINSLNNFTPITNSRSNATTNFNSTACTGTPLLITQSPTVLLNPIEAVFVLISHGQNGHGAFNINGASRITAGNASTISLTEQFNGGLDSAGVYYNNNRYFVNTPINLRVPTSGTNLYSDDIMRFLTWSDLVNNKSNLIIRNQGGTTNQTCLYAEQGIVAQDIYCGGSGGGATCRTNLLNMSNAVNALCF